MSIRVLILFQAQPSGIKSDNEVRITLELNELTLVFTEFS